MLSCGNFLERVRTAARRRARRLLSQEPVAHVCRVQAHDGLIFRIPILCGQQPPLLIKAFAHAPVRTFLSFRLQRAACS